VLQAYIQCPSIERRPLKELKAFKRVTVAKGGSKDATLEIPVSELKKWDLSTHQWKLYPGQYYICIGKDSNDFPLKKEFLVKP
jgi:beta-glucosidase